MTYSPLIHSNETAFFACVVPSQSILLHSNLQHNCLEEASERMWQGSNKMKNNIKRPRWRDHAEFGFKLKFEFPEITSMLMMVPWVVRVNFTMSVCTTQPERVKRDIRYIQQQGIFHSQLNKRSFALSSRLDSLKSVVSLSSYITYVTI